VGASPDRGGPPGRATPTIPAGDPDHPGGRRLGRPDRSSGRTSQGEYALRWACTPGEAPV